MLQNKDVSETARARSERLAGQIYDLHIEYNRVISGFDPGDKIHVAALAAMHKAVVDIAIFLARAVLDAKTEDAKGNDSWR